MAYLAWVILFPFKAEPREVAFLSFFFLNFKSEPHAGGEAAAADRAAPVQHRN